MFIGYGHKNVPGVKHSIELKEHEMYRLILNKNGAWAVIPAEGEIEPYDINPMVNPNGKFIPEGSKIGGRTLSPSCNVCYECGDGLTDFCEEDECDTTYCDFVDNYWPIPNFCNPKASCWTE